MPTLGFISMKLLTMFCPIHPGRLTWNLQITHLERNMIFQTSMVKFHVNLPGCNGIAKSQHLSHVSSREKHLASSCCFICVKDWITYIAFRVRRHGFKSLRKDVQLFGRYKSMLSELSMENTLVLQDTFNRRCGKVPKFNPQHKTTCRRDWSVREKQKKHPLEFWCVFVRCQGGDRLWFASSLRFWTVFLDCPS